MVFGNAGPKTENDCAGKSQQHITRPDQTRPDQTKWVSRESALIVGGQLWAGK
jgi:hypothetical protein